MRTGKAVAVIGSGPAGLAAADELNRPGHAVTVFERAGRIGGLLMYGIPNMKLDKDVVGRRVGLMEAEGVTFRTGVTVGADVTAEELEREFDAVVLATGATVARDLAVPGRELGGIHLAMSFLRGNTRRLLDGGAEAERADRRRRQGRRGHRRRRHRAPTASGRRSGRGRGACASWSSWPGRRSSAPPDNPWPEWPKVYKLDYGQEEAAALWGEDPPPLLHDDPPVHRPQRARDRASRSRTCPGSPGRTGGSPCARSRARPR